ncbi:GntR family transcriptional regulator [Sporosarcina sp. G11-34]|uniref:GntR family transcriptional regulator n=1 Tax=Sporosarcina sp. G11-34 TaxID=2849605 RepID=UPI0022A8FA94|nr:GntR family transcriptional regulator [Sporosarcina sp. G11-34]MCZ2258532.1 GntR family transcriptional regulator [Sporosarcina sp. G11-34]
MLDKQSTTPIYVQIEEYLKHRIVNGEYSKGQAIPSERELTDLFGVSRMTVRQSITNLVNEGLLYRERGRGTFVSSPKVEQTLSGLTSFTEDMIARGMAPSNKLLSFERQLPTIEIAQGLQLTEGDEVFSVKRIRYADDMPMAIERTYIPVKLVPELDQDAFGGSFYVFIEKSSEQKISHATQQMEAVLVKKEDAELLQMKVPAPVLIIERKSYLTNGLPFEIVLSTYRADRYKFVSEIRR